MKGLSIITAIFILVVGTVTASAANLERISAATGVSVETLQAERSSTGLGWGSLENAHLLANASGQSFDDIVALHQGGQGWGKIARDNGLNLGRLVSDAHRSSQATMHAQNAQTVHGKSAATAHGKSAATTRGTSATNIRRGHTAKTSTTRGVGHGSRSRSGFSGSHGVRSMGHMSGFRGGRSKSHGGGHGR